MKTLKIKFLLGLLSFVIFQQADSQNNSLVNLNDTDSCLIYSLGDKELFTYRYAMYYPPKNMDKAYRRSGFIHPLKSLSGETLTNFMPADHPHHYGMWYAWTKTTFEGNTIDFWNVNKHQGTVRFDKFIEKRDNGFKAKLNHIVYPDSSKEKVAMIETLDITVSPLSNNKGYYIDYTTEIECATKSPVTMEKYTYGGFVIRTRSDWNDSTTEMLTSEGKTRNEADGTHARWCYLQGKAGKSDACILIVASKNNLNYPEPLRVWDKNINPEAQDIMWNFSPTKEKSFTLHPGKTLKLKYRLYILNGKINKKDISNINNIF